MHVATNGEWTGGYSGQELDGGDWWEAISSNAASPRIETVHVMGDNVGTYTCILYDDMKYIKTYNVPEVSDPAVYFSEDQAPENAVTECVLSEFLDSTDAAAKKATYAAAVMKDVVETVSDVSYKASLSVLIGLSVVLVIMFAVKNLYDRYHAQSVQKREEVSLFEEDVKVSGYGSIRNLFHGP
jgi:hypothetical protein